MKTKRLLYAALVITLGIAIAGFGYAILLQAGMGSAPASTLIEGVHVFAGWNFFWSALLVNLLFTLVIIIFYRKLFGIGTILAIVLFGYFMDLGTLIVEPIGIAGMSVLARGAFAILGSIIAGIGIGVYVSVSAGMGPLEGPAQIVHEKFGIEFKRARWGQDILVTLLGILLGAAWGFGTVVSMIVVAPLIPWTVKILNEKVHRPLNMAD